MVGTGEPQRSCIKEARYREYYPEVSDLLVPGGALEDIVQTYAERAGIYGDQEERQKLIGKSRRDWKLGHSMIEPTPAGRWVETRDKATD